jgi:hypothetical protein
MLTLSTSSLRLCSTVAYSLIRRSGIRLLILPSRRVAIRSVWVFRGRCWAFRLQAMQRKRPIEPQEGDSSQTSMTCWAGDPSGGNTSKNPTGGIGVLRYMPDCGFPALRGLALGFHVQCNSVQLSAHTVLVIRRCGYGYRHGCKLTCARPCASPKPHSKERERRPRASAQMSRGVRPRDPW